MTLDLTVTPAESLLDVPREIVVSGARPGALVTVRATTERAGRSWSAQATYLADADGRVQPDCEAPVFGDYGRIDPMALLTSQRPVPESAEPRSAAPTGAGQSSPGDVLRPVVTVLEAWDESAPAERTTAQLTQHQIGPGVRRVEVRTVGDTASDAGGADAVPLVGTLFVPPGPGPHPTVVVLSGSGGGIQEQRGALYASHGIQAFALGYFRVPGRSDFITRTPLEYFESALRWVHRELAPRAGVVVVSGQSRGGELALLLGATYPDLVGAVVAYVPGAHVHGSQGAADPAEGWDSPTWTLDGRPLTHLWQDNPGVTWQPWTGGPPPDRNRDVYLDGLRDRDFAEQSRIPVERIAGPVLCLSGMDDGLWPSSLYSRQVVAALRAADHPHEILHLDYPDAGHSIALPHLPVTVAPTRHPVSGVAHSTGGTPAGGAFANADSFPRVCAFVERATAAPTTPHDLPTRTTHRGEEPSWLL